MRQGGDTMATSRTGTSQWIKIRKQRRQLDLDNGVYNCPICRTQLDWEYSGHPNSAEVDHIKSHAQGGQDTLENTRVICRKCNQTLGGKTGRKQMLRNKTKPKPLKLSPRG